MLFNSKLSTYCYVILFWGNWYFIFSANSRLPILSLFPSIFRHFRNAVGVGALEAIDFRKSTWSKFKHILANRIFICRFYLFDVFCLTWLILLFFVNTFYLIFHFFFIFPVFIIWILIFFYKILIYFKNIKVL